MPRVHANSHENGFSGGVCRLRVRLREGLECVLRTYTLSPHFVSTLCRLRFVSTLCPYTLSKAKEQANVPAFPVRFGCVLEPAVSAVYCGAHGGANVPPGILLRQGYVRQVAVSSVPAIPFAQPHRSRRHPSADPAVGHDHLKPLKARAS